MAGPAYADESPQADNQWWQLHSDGSYSLDLYFFWTETCPHCTAARPDIAALAEELSWVRVHSLPLTGHPQNLQLYMALADSMDEHARSVPGFLFCGRLLTGYDDADHMGVRLRRELAQCRQALVRGEQPVADVDADTRLPLFGEVDLTQWSLPLVTVTLAILDSFNPCAFFVLLFLLSVLVNARSRTRMLLVGGVFVGISGLVYFFFMAAWLNLFLLLGQMHWITLVAGLLALVVGVINIKDFFWLKRGVTLSISEPARGGLFKRMRTLVNADSVSTMLLGSVVLAVLANAYELLCTAGFPMVFTRILTLNELPESSYYVYLALYCVVYILPLSFIVLLFTVTLGRRKLSEAEGRLLKLMSGLMMAGLGLILVIQPELLNNLFVTTMLVVVVLLVTLILRKYALRVA